MRRLVLLLGLAILMLGHKPAEDWGFFGHRLINRMAVFTLPQGMVPLYKKNLSYIEEHSVDPDKRRYATKHEAVRHYIDLDQWGTLPYDNVPREFIDALLKYGKFISIKNRDTSTVTLAINNNRAYFINEKVDTIADVSYSALRVFGFKHILPNYYEDEITIPMDSINPFFKKVIFLNDVTFVDGFSEHGILPYHLPEAMRKLTMAFKAGDVEKILRNSAEIGHYIGDAHVPLHTTKNYNGQLTDQVGIHGFWESRLPELFAKREYDFFVGKAEYITKPKEYFWEIVLESHSYLNDVLTIEKNLSKSFPTDRQWCYDQRLGQTIRIQCEEYSKAYHEAMQGMVEKRLTQAIKAIGSVWYTAWIDGGQPDLKLLQKQYKDLKIKEENIIVNPNIKIRDHEN